MTAGPTLRLKDWYFSGRFVWPKILAYWVCISRDRTKYGKKIEFLFLEVFPQPLEYHCTIRRFGNQASTVGIQLRHNLMTNERNTSLGHTWGTAEAHIYLNLDTVGAQYQISRTVIPRFTVHLSCFILSYLHLCPNCALINVCAKLNFLWLNFIDVLKLCPSCTPTMPQAFTNWFSLNCAPNDFNP